MKDLASSIFILLGASFICIASIGLLRMPELYMRIHSSTKAGTLGLGFILLGVAIHFQQLNIVIRAFAAIGFIVLTAPVAAHVIGRVGYITGVKLWKGSVVNEIKEDGGQQ